MPDLPDYSRSRAILIGTGSFQDPGFPPLPAVANSLAGMRQILTHPDLCGWPAGRVTVLEDPTDVRMLVKTLRGLARDTNDVLLVYFVGHGVMLRRGQLCLVLADTEADHADVTGLEYKWVRDALLDSPARLKVVVLDCCYAGRAYEALSATTEAAADSADTQGVYTLTASDQTAHVVPLEEQANRTTSFTGELLDLVRTGIPGGPEQLTLGILYPRLRQRLQQRGLPMPNRRGTDTADQFPFTRNAARTDPMRPPQPPRPAGITAMGRAVAIDFGPSNSVVATLEGGEPIVIANAEGSRTTPSVVAFAENGEVLIGEAAKRQAVTNVDRTIRSVQLRMGTDWTTTIDGKVYTPQQISALLLRKLKRDAESYLHETVTDAVMTVPAYFSDEQRQANVEAAQIAGLNVLHIINEPTAAVLAHHLEETEANILVFDLGGGTLAVSLLEVGDGVVEVKAISGDNDLGGDDWDDKIVDWLVTRFRRAHRIDLGKDKMALQRLREAAEKAKIELSGSWETTINQPYLTLSAEGPLHLEEKLTRVEFQKITADLLERCKDLFQQVIEDAGISISEIDHVVLVGGGARMPAVSELIVRLTGGKEPTTALTPDAVVAVGAALHMGLLTGQILS
jgi:actin-like ATPase involved in cell morphogenesis